MSSFATDRYIIKFIVCDLELEIGYTTTELTKDWDSHFERDKSDT